MKENNSIIIVLIDNFIWIIILGMLVSVTFFIPSFLTIRNVINIFYHSAALAILVLGETFVIVTGNIDLSVEPSLGISVAIPGLLAMVWVPQTNIPTWIFVLIALCIGSVIGLINGIFITKVKINSFLMTLSMYVILYGFLYYLVPKSLDNIYPKYGWLGNFILGIPSSIFLVISLYVLFGILLYQSTFGRILFATGENKIAALIAGIKIDNIVIIAYVISGALASVAGLIILGRNIFISNNMGSGLLFMTIAASVLGGARLEGGTCSVLGAFGGVILITIIDNILAMCDVSPYLVYTIKGLLIFLAVWIDSYRERIRKAFLIKKVKIIT